jgi:cyclic beta-1,2-glucan synthetase
LIRRRASRYLINVENPDGVNRGVQRVTLDGKVLTDNRIPLSKDGGQHEVQVVLGHLMME